MLLLCSLLASASPADGEPVDDPAASAALAAADALVTEAHRLAERGDPHGKSRPGLRAAAMAYQVFIKDFPLSERGPDALLTAGVLLERLGDARQAQEIFEAHVALYPDDERTNPLLFRLAAGHQSRLELDRAIGYYERLAHVGGQDYPDTPSAAYSAAFLRGVQGDHRGAAEGLERYVRDFPEQPDIWAVLSMAGPHWEAVGEREAAAFYQRLLQHSSPDADLSAQALYRLATLQTDPRGAARAWNQLGAYLQQAAARLGSSPERARYAALLMIRELEGELAALAAAPDPRRPLAELLAMSRQLQGIGDPVGVTAGLYFSGMGSLVVAGRLEEPALAEAGHEQLRASLQAAQSLRVYSPWVDRAVAALSATDPTWQPLPPLSTPAPLPPGDPHLALAATRIAAGDLLAARDALVLWQHSAPDAEVNASLHTALADVHTLRGEHDLARARLEQAVDINPDFAPALHRLAQHELRLYRLTEAAALLAVASEQAPDDPAIAADLAIARQRVR